MLPYPLPLLYPAHAYCCVSDSQQMLLPPTKRVPVTSVTS